MSNGSEKMQVEFHNKAKESFFSVHNAFENATATISRRTDEYQFQELKKQYAISLEQQLQTVAESILVKYRDEKQSREVGKMFHQLIKEYLHRFIQKINA